jgi:hypothetical protein
MAAIPYQPLGIGKNGIAFQSDASPVGPAKKQYVSENGTASSVITFTDNTTVVEVAAVDAPVFIRWIPTTDTQASVIGVAGSTANYDDVIPKNTTRIFPIPAETQGTASIVGANKQNGLYNRIAWKTGGIGSILAVEF